MRALVVPVLVLAACGTAQVVNHEDAPAVDGRGADGPARDGGSDAAGPDAASVDAAAPDAASVDAAGPDARPIDAGAPDALVVDALMPDAPPCPIAGAAAINLTGTNDLAAYPAAQTVPVGAPFTAADAVRLSWSPTALYLTVHSTVFADGSRPYHLYVEAATTLGTATPADGKEYGGLIAHLPFTPTHLVAMRRTDDFGSGAYDGVYVPTGGWATRATPLVPGADVFAAAGQDELSVRVPWAALGGCPTHLRVAGHVVNGAVGNEWKTLVPTASTPWTMPAGTAYTIDLTGPAAVSGWTQ